jgi:Holliday junction resolvasome RuvABC endonuclease subunit
MRIVSIDPGTRFIGFACLEICESMSEARVLDAYTLRLEKLAKRVSPDVVEHYGERVAHLLHVKEAVTKYCYAWSPLVVCSEDPYMHLFPQTFSALTECVLAIQNGAMQYDNTITFRRIKPSVAKNAVGVHGMSGDKEAVREGIRHRAQLNIDDVDLDSLDEHSCDAIAIGCGYVMPCLLKVPA